MFDGEDPRAVATSACEELARIIGLISGEIRITVSESKAVKIEARQHVRVCCVQRKQNVWVAPDDDLELVMDQAPDFVMRELEELIVSMVGRFGYLEAEMDQGSVSQLMFNTSVRPGRRRSGTPSR